MTDEERAKVARRGSEGRTHSLKERPEREERYA